MCVTARHLSSLGTSAFCSESVSLKKAALWSAELVCSAIHIAHVVRTLHFVGTCPARCMLLLSVSFSLPASTRSTNTNNLHGESVRIRSHFAHAQLWCLAVGHRQNRRLYEELRGAYNSVRSAGSGAAPAFEQWRSMADLCDHPVCRCETASSPSRGCILSCRQGENQLEDIRSARCC